MNVCAVEWRGEEGVFFLSSFFLPLSMSVLYPTPLFSIFTCSSRCEGSEILNYRNGLVSALRAVSKTTQPLLSPDLTHTHTLSHTLIITFQTVPRLYAAGEESKSTVTLFYLSGSAGTFASVARSCVQTYVIFVFTLACTLSINTESSSNHSWILELLQKCLEVHSL